jgi:hypothetical protein
MTLSHQYAHTIAFSAPVREETEKNRRVSFAPNMHVRYLEYVTLHMLLCFYRSVDRLIARPLTSL